MLDEPTNDLDLPTLRILEEALISFAGCVIIVSHDRYFLNRVCNGILAFEEGGNVHFSEGNYDYYLQKRKVRKAMEVPMQSKEKTEEKKAKPKVKKLSWKETKELETIEERIITGEKEIERIETIFSSSDFYENYAARTNELTLQLDDAKQAVKILYERWDELEKLRNDQ